MLTALLVLVALQQPTYFAASESSYLFGERWDFKVTHGELENSPRWTQLQDDPPLSLRQAIGAGERRLTALVPDVPNWHLQRVTINPTAVKDVWFYVVEFRSAIPGIADGPTRSLRVIVLMSGFTPEPTRSPWPEPR